MPRIILKQNSPEYADSYTTPKVVRCDMPGCNAQAEHRCPKDRALGEYYNFCFEHAREYNKAWDFFSGMAEQDVQEHMQNSRYGDRPTWRYDNDAKMEDNLRDAASRFAGFQEDVSERRHKQRAENILPPGSPEFEALAIMGLELPLDLVTLKTRYKELAKKHHPDRNKGCKKSEELLKKINMAYTVLKLAHEKFQNLPA